ncbi:MAG: NAD(P)/FAD-dependent oxidoreductase [Desulfobacterales bacterium]|nr:NAD(P)/FAD-dependent oxidoreductase [Desulfobacterales bacterium]
MLLIDRSGGRTWHAKHIENFLTQKDISGSQIVRLGIEQAKSFNVKVRRGLVTKILKPKDVFEVYTEEGVEKAQFVIVSSGVMDNLPEIENVHTYLGTSFFTCVDCDGYRCTGKKLLVIGNSIYTVRLAFAMKEMFTKDVALLLCIYDPPEDYKEELADQG